MTFSGHLATAGLVLTLTDNLVVAAVACFALHLILDAVPHAEWDRWGCASPIMKRFIVADCVVTIALAVLLYMAFANPWLVSIAIITSLLPDLTDGLARHYAQPFRRLHDGMHTVPCRPSNTLDWNRTFTGRTPTSIKVGIQMVLIAVSVIVVVF